MNKATKWLMSLVVFSVLITTSALSQTNLVSNGDFENGATSWEVNYGDPATPDEITEGGNSFFYADVETAGDAFAVNLKQILEITQGTTYTFSFDASSAGNGRTIIAGIGLNEAPWSAAVETATLTSATQTFSYQLTAGDFGIANSRVLFDMGADTGVVVIDNISLVANESTGGETTAFCAETRFHLGIEAEVASAILLTIENVDASSMKVTIESADADPVDELIVNNLTGPITGNPAVSEIDNSVAGKLSRTLTWSEAPPTDVELAVLWSKVSFGGNWQSSSENLSVPFNNSCSASDIPSLFFSEYIEGSGNNKALEIYNPTGSPVSLDNYQIAQSSNGGGWAFFHTSPASSEIAAGDVYVIITDAVDPALFDASNADEVLGFPSTVHHNGNDARAIIHIAGTDTTILDVFGDPDSDTTWDVAGVSEGAREHTLIRKPEVMMGNPTPLGSFGTNADDSEWIVNDQNDFSNLGMYGMAPGPVSVTFNVNTATMPDTLMPSHTIQLRGGLVGADVAGTGLGSMVTWDSQSIVSTNVGGDYWTLTFDMSPGDTLNYKWWAGTDVDNGLANGGETGWESGGNNQFILPMEAVGDTTVPLQWFETRMKPFETKTDTVGVWFRVNVGAQIQDGSFDPAQGGVEVRGTPAPLTWDANTAAKLTSEGQVGKNHFYSGVVYYDRAELQASAPDSRPAGTIKYKFYMDKLSGDGWEGGNDKFMTVPNLMDTTNHWSYFNGERPSDEALISTTLNFEVNVGILEGIGFFNSAVDTVYVRGDFNGWSTDNQMTFNDISGNYDELNIPFTGVLGKEVPYKYYLKWDSRRDSSDSDLFLEGIEANNSGWEEPGSTAGGNRILTIEDAADQAVRSEAYNDVPPQALITPALTEGGSALVATFSIDMQPAADRTDGTTAFDAAKDSVFLIVDTPFFALTNGIIAGDGDFATRSAEQRDKVMFTDDNNDMIYTLDLTLADITLNNIGFRIAYGEPTSETGELIINGEGFDAGRRYYQFIQPIVSPDGDDLDDRPDVSWPATYAFPQLTWSPRDLAFETPPDYDTITSSSELEGDKANVFVLNQNYPNPFNPSTNISFSMPNAANVTLKVYNVLGQEVVTLINNKALNSGTHSVAFDASALSSGMYIYRIEAGSFVSTKRMMLIK
jgi:hypothetical protein